MNKEKEELKSKLCIKNKSKEESEVVQKSEVPTHPNFHRSVKELFGILSRICQYTDEHAYTITSFKAALSLYFGFHERNVGPRFNLLASLGVIEVTKKSKKQPHGRVVINMEVLSRFTQVEGDTKRYKIKITV